MVKHLQKLSALVVASLCLFGGYSAHGQVAVSSFPYNQNFNGIGTTFPAGWTAVRHAGSGTAGEVLTLSESDGNSNSGGVYSVGADTERAIGSLGSGSTVPMFGAGFTNNTGAAINSMTISAVLEQWRSGSSASTNEVLPFEYSTNASAINDANATWNAVTALDLTEILTTTTSAAAVNGNENKANLSADLDGLNWANGATLWIRWKDTNDSGSDGMYAVDDFSISSAVADEAAPVVATYTPANGATGVGTIANLSLTFDETVEKGTGNIVLKNAAGDAVLKTIEVTSEDVVVEENVLTISTTLQPGTAYYVQIAEGAFTDLAGNAFAGISNNTTWTFTTATVATPVITASVANLSFGALAEGDTKVISYTLNGTDLQGDVTLTTAAPFAISKTAGNFATSLTLTEAEAEAGTTVYVQVAGTELGAVVGRITHESPEAGAIEVALSATVSNPYAQNFNDCIFGSEAIPGGWTQVSLSGNGTWECTDFGLDGTGAVQMNGYDSDQGGSVPNEDWLISQAIDLTALPKPRLSFWSSSKYSGPGLKLMVSTTYNGTGTINAADWTELAADFPVVNSDTWTQTHVSLNNYKEEEAVYVAFVYTSGSGSNQASRWIVDNVEVTDVSRLLTTENVNIYFGETAVGATSAAEQFSFTAEGYAQDVVVTAPEGFELSKENAAFAQSLTYTAAEAAEENAVFVRFKPTTSAVTITGPVTFTSGNELNEQRGMLSGSSILRANTLDIATWNLEWFGSTGNGPSDEQLQFENARKVLAGLNADIIAVQEISDDATIRALAEELGYGYENMDASWQSGSGYQKVYMLYNPDVVTVKKEKILLLKLYEDIRAGRATLPDYPSSSSTFWASGRLPYLVQFEVNINGVTQTVNVVNIHAKANSGEDIVQYNRRKYDVQVLKDSLDVYYANTNLVLLGDYNDDVDMSVVGTNNPSTYAPFVTDEAYSTLTYDLSVADGFTYASGSLRSFLDHIIISKPLVNDYISSSILIETQFLNSIENFRETTSDHVPVSARFNLIATPEISFSQAASTIGEDAGTFDVTLTLSEAQATAQTFTIALIEGGTASSDDYEVEGMEEGSVTVTMPADATTATFSLTVTDDNTAESAEQASFRISSTSSDIVVGENATYTLVIEDNDNTTGIADATKGQFRVYPNPVETHVNLLLPERVAKQQTISLTVYGMDGKELFTVKGGQENVQQVLNAEAANFKHGLYILKVVAGKEVFQSRMLKK